MKMRARMLFTTFAMFVLLAGVAVQPSATAQAKYDITTLAGKVASVNGTAGLQIRFSAFIEEQADTAELAALGDGTGAPIKPTFVLSSPLDGTAVKAPDVTVNNDTAAAPQNETAIAVDPNNPNRVLAAANDYVPRTWSCTIGSTPPSGLGDADSG